jgi:hypothetical protein
VTAAGWAGTDASEEPCLPPEEPDGATGATRTRREGTETFCEACEPVEGTFESSRSVPFLFLVPPPAPKEFRMLGSEESEGFSEGAELNTTDCSEEAPVFEEEGTLLGCN